jgi:hypothetical protein
MAQKKTHKAKVLKKRKWFIKVRGSYLPNSREGWLTYIPFIIGAIGVLYWAYADVSDAFTELGSGGGWYYVSIVSAVRVLPGFALLAFGMTQIAKRKS